MIRFLNLAGVLLIVGCATAGPHVDAFRLRPGDLLFQDLDAGPLCDAIETVTLGVNGSHFSHVGMVSRVDEYGQATIIEAVGAGVVETPLRTFLKRSADRTGNPKVVVGRLKAPFDALIEDAVANARGYLGRPYDWVYTMETDAFYCSELLYTSFRDANGGREIFPLFPMTFDDPATSSPFPAWSAYYDSLGIAIPEGAPGLNPGGMSRSPTLRIVHAYGRPDGWRGALPVAQTP